jgi:hypothetical protein
METHPSDGRDTTRTRGYYGGRSQGHRNPGLSLERNKNRASRDAERRRVPRAPHRA